MPGDAGALLTAALAEAVTACRPGNAGDMDRLRQALDAAVEAADSTGGRHQCCAHRNQPGNNST